MHSRNGTYDPGDRPGAPRVIDLRDADASRPKPLAGEFSGPEAADLAGISYRQLDYWARRRWVVPSRTSAYGVQRRVYTAADVVRLAALGHLGRSRVDVATYGEATGSLQIPNGLAFLVVWGTHDESVVLASAKDLRQVACNPGRYVIFDPAPVLRELQRRRSDAGPPRPRRRTFTDEYKLGVLAEYERLAEPGAKSALLRREGLHTSHLVAWRRGREAGELAPAATTGHARRRRRPDRAPRQRDGDPSRPSRPARPAPTLPAADRGA